MRQARANTDRLAQPDRASASDRYHRVGLVRLRIRQGFICDVRWRVHGRFGEDARDLSVQDPD